MREYEDNFRADIDLACHYALSKPKRARAHAKSAIDAAYFRGDIPRIMQANDLLAALEV